MDPYPSFPLMELLVLLFLTIVNGFFALTEIALVSVKRSRMELLASEGSQSAKIVLELLENPANFLSSVQVGITLIGIVAGAYGGQAVAGYLQPFFESIPFLAGQADMLSLAVSITLITYVSIVIGELVPKTIALNNPEPIALFSVPILRYFMVITYPFVRLLGLSTTALLKMLGVSEKSEESMSEDELIAMLNHAGKQGVIDKEETEVHHNLFSFADQTAKSLLTHRSQIEWIDVHDSKREIIRKTQESVHSKFVVADRSLDTIVGIVRLRDFFEHMHDEDRDIRSILQDPIIVNESTPAFRILNMFKKRKQYMAVVVDEYGGTSGIITLHDLIEVIVGDLPDEDEAELEPNIIKRDEHSYLVSGSTLIYELNQYFHEEILEDEMKQYTSVAGFIMAEFQHLPQSGEFVELGGYRFEVVDIDGVKIDKLLMSRMTDYIDRREVNPGEDL